MYRRKSKCLSIPENNGDEAPKGPRPIVFQEWTETWTFFNLKYTSTEFERPGISKGKLYFTHVHEDTFYIV